MASYPQTSIIQRPRQTFNDGTCFTPVGVATSYIVRLRAGASHILYNGDDIIKGAGNTTIVFGVTDELANLEARPIGTDDVQLEIFIGLV